MRLGFTGAHRTGKSTLAQIIATDERLTMVKSPAGEIVKSFGFDMATDNRLVYEAFDEKTGDVKFGTDMQWAIYDTLVESLKEAAEHGGYVSDRTPIDVAAYLMADATAYAGEPGDQAATVRMVEQAIRDTQALFDIVILVPPAIDFVAEAGKPPMNQAYQEHHHMLCRGILFDEDLDLYWDEIRRDTFSLSARMEFVRGMTAEWKSTQGPNVLEAA